MPKKLIKFSVGINYESSNGSSICNSSLTDALLAKIKWATQQGILTPDHVSASDVSVNTKEIHQVSKSERTIEFSIGVTYEFDSATTNDSVFLDSSLAENLFYAIEKSRCSGQNGEGLYLVKGDVCAGDISALPLYSEMTKAVDI